MRIGFDLDRVIFKTDEFRRDRDRELGMHHVEADVFDQNDNYDQRKHARHCGVSDEDLESFMHDLENYLDPSLHLLTELNHHELVLVTRGNREFQKAKVEGSGASKYFDRVEYIEKGSKDQANIDVLIDDSPDELEMVETGILYETEKGLNQIFQKLTELKAEKVFKRYDIRGEFQEEIDQFFAKRLGLALSKISDKWVVGRDTKKNSKMIKEELINGLVIGGSKVIYVGEGPTDHLSFAAVREECPGIQITASHLKLENTGFKLVYSEGNSFVNESLEEVEELFFETSENLLTTPINREKIIERKNYLDKWKSKIVSVCRDKGFKFNRTVVIDSLGGSGRIAKEVLESLGFQVIENLRRGEVNPPDPEKQDLTEFEKTVEESGAYAGLVFDMDADRVRIYKDGWVSGHQMIQVFSKITRAPYVVSDDATQEFNGSNIYRTRVGDPFVLEKMLEENAGFSGEPNGHYAFKDLTLYNSGVLAGCLAVSIDLESKIEDTTRNSFLKKSFRVKNKEEVLRKVKSEVPDESIVSKKDGITYNEGSAFVLIRSSGTSPLVRVQIESESTKSAEKMMDKVKRRIKNTGLLEEEV